MANTLEILDLGEQHQVRVAFIDESGARESAPPSAFAFPLSESETAEIRWYFKQYPDDPYGPSKERAEAVEAGFRDLGRLLTESVFRAGSEARQLLDRALESGASLCLLSIVSENVEFHTLPWELLNEPDAGYLVHRFSGVARRLSSSLPVFQTELPDSQFNVLLVSSPGPDSPSENSGGIATESIGAMEALDAEVDLDCVRFTALSSLSDDVPASPGYYHLAHLDGFAASADGSLALAPDAQGDPLGALLAANAAPVVLLATNSPHAHEAAIRLASDAGAPFVVLLPHALAGSGRILFAEALYTALARGAGVPEAVAAARRALIEHPHRPSAAGPFVSWDWITPVVYQSSEYAPTPIQPKQDDTPIPGMLPATPEAPPRELPRGGPYGLIGRRREVLQLEAALDDRRVVLLTGSVGSGKSQLALGLASYLEKSGGRSAGVFYTTFDVGAGLEKVVHETGTALAGLEFGDLRPIDRRRWLLQYLRENETLLVWDQAENLAGFPTGATGLLEETELKDLDDFLAELALEGGRSWVLLVSRREESWLSAPHGVFQLAGLSTRDRVEFGTRLLEESGVDPGRLGPEYAGLLDLAEGHPLALELAVPLLNEVPASVLLGELRQGLEKRQPGAGEEGRPGYLTALMEQSFSRMSRRSRTHLPFLSLFRNRVMMDILTHITQESVYRSVMGEQMGWGACRTLLRSARSSGFLEPVTPSVYQIHPALPWFYGRSLYQQLPVSRIAQLEAEFVRVFADTADYFMETLYENQDSGTTAILAEEGNLTQALALALEGGQWDNAQLLVQPLAQVYRMQKRYPELRRLRRQLLDVAGQTAAEAEGRGATELWLYLLGTEAGECIETGELERADEMNRQLLDHLSAQAGSDEDPRTAAVYHQMGEVALKRWRLDDAEEWYGKSLAIIEEGEDRSPVADDYYGMGLVRQYQRRYTEAKDWFSRSLDIHQRLEDVEEMVKDYRSLGLCAQYRFEYQEAESWYHRAREILEEARDEETSVSVYHSLGTVAHAQYAFDEAENWYKQSLTLSDRIGNGAQMAVEFHHLGLLAQAREIFFDDAEQWYNMALEKFEELGDWRSAGDECRQLGVLFHEQQRLEEAEGWYHRAREIFEEIQDPGRVARTYGQLGMISEQRDDLEGALSWAGRTYQLAAQHGLPVLDQVRIHLARLRDKYGAENFAAWWQDFAGEAAPTDLDVDPETIM